VDWFLITADVESLYTNMKIDPILKSVMEIFSEYPDPDCRFVCMFIVQLLYFMYNLIINIY